MKQIVNHLEEHNFLVKGIRIFTVPILNNIPGWLIKKAMKKSSKDASTVVAKGGTTHALEAMYGRSQRTLFSRGISQGVADILWHHLISQPKAIRNRLKIVCRVFEEKIVYLFDKKNSRELSILSIAGGSSRSIMYALQNLKTISKNDKIKVITVDKDAAALDVGKKVAKELEFENNFEWIHGTASEISTLFPNRKFDLVEIVGLLDYFDFERAVRLLTMSRELMNKDGFIIIANVIPNREQPFVHKTGWPEMYYREPNEVARLLEASGFIGKNNVIVEPLKIHCVAVGQK